MGGLLAPETVAAPALRILPASSTVSRWEDLECHDIAVGSAGTTYIALGGGGVAMLDASLNELGRLPTEQPVRWVAATGALLATGTRGGDLQLYDVRDAAHPVFQSGLSLGQTLSALAFAGDRLYAGDEAGGFHILDVREPTALKRLGGFPDSFDNEGGITFVRVGPEKVRFAIRGNLLYRVGPQSHLTVFEVSDPQKIRVRAGQVFPAPPLDVALGGNQLFVSLGSRGVSVLDLANPAIPSVTLTTRPPVAVNFGSLAARSDGTRVAVRAGAQGVAILEKGGNLGWRWAYVPDSPADRLEGRGILIDGERCLTTWQSWLMQRELGSTGEPGLPNFRELTGDSPFAVELQADRLYVQYFGTELPYPGGRVAVLDVRDRLHPQWLGRLNAPRSGASAVAITPTVTCFSGAEGLFVAASTNVSGDGAFLSHLALTNATEGLAVVDDYAYVGTEDGLRVVSLREPTRPEVVAQLPELGRIGRIAVGQEGLVLVHYFPRTVTRVDLADPAHPRVGASYSVPAGQQVRALTLAGGRAYLILQDEPADSLAPFQGARLLVLELSATGTPRELGSFPLRSRPHALQVFGDRAVVAYQFVGTYLLDVADPNRIRELAMLVPPNFANWNMDPLRANSLGYDGITLFQADPRTGVGLFGTSEPTEVVLNVLGLEPGAPWSLESSDALFPPNWTRVTEVRTNLAGSCVADGRTPRASQRYYRLRTDP